MIPLIRSTFYHESDTKRKLNTFITHADHLSFGAACETFEKQFAEYQGRKECVLANSGSSANMAVIQALLNLGWLKPGDFVGFSAVTWSTNAMPLIQLGLQPVSIDAAIETLNISRETLEKAYSVQPFKLLFITHLLGLCSDLDEIVRFCKQQDILMVEDTCESLGSVYKGKRLGNFGLAATFSFYVGHHLSTIEGGAIVTNNQALADMLRIVRAHGWDRNLTLEGRRRVQESHHVNSTFYSRYTFYDLGFNFRTTEICGFLGQLQLKWIDEIVHKRQHHFMRFAEAAYARTDLYIPLRYSHMDTVSAFAMPLICTTPALRRRLVDACAETIEVRPIVGGNIVQQPFFKKYCTPIIDDLPNAEKIHKNGLYMGNHPELSKKEIDTMIATVCFRGE
jgi:CDP-6-deoxy-D-xylo-4-hexulose-3-dehydrase